MLARRFTTLLIVTAGLALVACSDKASEPPVPPVPQASPQAAVAKTVGTVQFNGVPEQGVTAREIILVRTLSSDGLARLERQRELLEFYITGVDPEDLYPAAGPKDVSVEDSAKFVERLEALGSEYPAPLSVEVKVTQRGVDDDRLRKFNSSGELHKDYARLFKSIDWSNIKRGIEFINETLIADGKSRELLVGGDDPFASEQAQVDLKWMQEVVKHLESYLKLANERIEARNEYVSQLTDPQNWPDYCAKYAHSMTVDVSGRSLGDAIIAEDGSFEVAARGGMPIVRIEYGAISAYYLPGEGEERVVITGLREFEE